MTDQNKPYDQLTIDLIGAAKGRASLCDEVNELIQRAGLALREQGAGKKATITVKIDLVAHRPNGGDVERIDALGSTALKLPSLPQKLTTAFFVRDGADLVTADHRQQTMLDDERRRVPTTLTITRPA